MDTPSSKFQKLEISQHDGDLGGGDIEPAPAAGPGSIVAVVSTTA